MKPKATMSRWKSSTMTRKPSRTSGGRGSQVTFTPPSGGWRGAELTADMQQNGPMFAHRKQSNGG